jgi:hypothetical protein
MANALKIAPPPPRRLPIEDKPPSVATPARAVSPPKFNQAKEDGRVQFNKRVTQRVADGFDMLAIRTRRKVPELLAEALELLEERYGKV